MSSLIKQLSIDIETYSSVDLKKAGVYRYAEASDYKTLLFGYAVDGGEVQVVDLANGEKIPPVILVALQDDSVLKWAFNANFERICLSRELGLPTGTYLNPKSWRCSMVWAAYLGLPMSLAAVARVLKLKDQKLEEGKALIKLFCSPVKVKGGTKVVLPSHEPLKWEQFKTYNKRDVEVETAIQTRLVKFPVPSLIWDEYCLDQTINDRGVLIDQTFVKNAIEIDEKATKDILFALKNITELENPNSVQQLTMWLEKHGVEVESLGKQNVARLKQEYKGAEIGNVLKLRQMLAKTSTSKYKRMLEAVCRDGRIRGMFFFYGASRTGRFSSKIVQLQNLPQNQLADLNVARSLVRDGDMEAVALLYENIPDTLSQLIRTSFVPRPGYKYIVADFAAIEARILATLANEEWRVQAFRNGEDIYCASASKMFNKVVTKDGVNKHLRQKGKIAELALGYGGSVGALEAMGALDNGLSEDELRPLVNVWRAANPKITSFWWAIDAAVQRIIKPSPLKEVRVGAIKLRFQSQTLFITLPSGHELAYIRPRIVINKFGREGVAYEGTNGPSQKWSLIDSYGPKFVENIVQAYARDLLTNAMRNLQDYQILMHIHDEIVVEVPEHITVSEIIEKMSKPPSWAPDLALSADGFATYFYQKE